MTKNKETIKNDLLAPVYGSRWDIKAIAKDEIPQEMMRKDQAYQIIRDEMNLQGNPDLNLATFVTTWMEPEAEELALRG